MSDFNYKSKEYPNGENYYELFVGKTRIGIVDLTENKYLAQGRRKPVVSLKEAGKQLLDSHMNNCMKEHEKWRKLLNRMLKEK